MRHDTEHHKLVNEFSEEFKIDIKSIDEIITSPFSFIREVTKSIDLRGDESKEEFEEKTKNFNIPSICKLYANYNNFKKINYANNKKGKSVRRRKRNGDEEE